MVLPQVVIDMAAPDTACLDTISLMESSYEPNDGQNGPRRQVRVVPTLMRTVCVVMRHAGSQDVR